MGLEEQLIDLKVNLNLKGQILLNTWSELTALLDTYQAKLAVKEIQAKVRYENTPQEDFHVLKEEMAQLKTELTQTQNEVHEKDNMIFKLKTDLARLQSKLIVTQQKLDTGSESGSNLGMDLTIATKGEQDDEESGKSGNSSQAESWEIRDAETSSVVFLSEHAEGRPQWTPSPSASGASHKRKSIQPARDRNSTKIIKTEPSDSFYESDMSMSESSNCFYQSDRPEPGERAPHPVPVVVTKTDTAFCSHPIGNGLIPAEGTNLVIHAREQIPATEKILRPRRRCHLCYSQGKRKDTRFYCPACPRQPAFCADPCFEIYHSKLHKVSIPEGVNPTMAVKHEFMKGEIGCPQDDAIPEGVNQTSASAIRHEFVKGDILVCPPGGAIPEGVNPTTAIKQEYIEGDVLGCPQDGASNSSNGADT